MDVDEAYERAKTVVMARLAVILRTAEGFERLLTDCPGLRRCYLCTRESAGVVAYLPFRNTDLSKLMLYGMCLACHELPNSEELVEHFMAAGLCEPAT